MSIHELGIARRPDFRGSRRTLLGGFATTLATPRQTVNLIQEAIARPETPTASIADRLVWAHQGLINLQQAEKIAIPRITDYFSPWAALVFIARKRIEANLDPEPIITKLQKIIEPFDKTEQRIVILDVATIFRNAGRFEEEEAFLAQIGQVNENRFYFNRAKLKYTFGKDPIPDLKKETEDIEKQDATRPGSRARRYTDLGDFVGNTLHQDPSPYLQKAEQAILEYERENPNEKEWNAIYRTAIATIYEEQGNFTKAGEVQNGTAHLPYPEPRANQNPTLLDSAKKELEEERFENALAIAHTALSKTSPASKAYVFVEIHAFITRVLAASGQNFKQSLQQTFTFLEQMGPEHDKEIFVINLAKELGKAHINKAIPLFEKAREMIDAMTQAPGFEDDLDLQRLAFGQLMEAEVELGCLDQAAITYKKILSIPDKYGNDFYESAIMGAEQIKQGLTQKEIQGLSKKDIQTLLESGDPHVVAALEYFGLTPSPSLPKRGVLFGN